MLSRVLLHVVEASRPVDFTPHGFALRLRSENVGHLIAFVNHVQHGNASEGTAVRGLAARFGIERAVVEIDSKALWPGLSLEHPCFEVPQVAVCVVEPFRRHQLSVLRPRSFVTCSPVS